MSTQPNINASRIDGALSLSGSVFAPSISATTFYSGSTNLSSLLGGGGSVTVPTNQIAYGDASSAITSTPALIYSPSSNLININGSLFLGNISSGNYGIQGASTNTVIYNSNSTAIIALTSGQITHSVANSVFTGAITANTISATTFYSGSTNLSSLLGGSSTTVSGGTNISVTTVGSTATVNGTTVHTRGTNLSLNYSYTDYLFNGGAGVTWTLQALKADHKYTITNIGSNSLTVNSNAGANDIYDTSGAGAVNTISINQNESYLFIGNGTYWVARKIGM